MREMARDLATQSLAAQARREARRQAALKLVRDGYCDALIARRLGCSPDAVGKIRRAEGLPAGLERE